MWKEEKELRAFSKNTWGGKAWDYDEQTGFKEECRLIRALTRAVREDCAKVVEGNKRIKGLMVAREIADAIRKGRG